MIQVGPALKKWALYDDTQVMCVEADEDLDKVSDFVLHRSLNRTEGDGFKDFNAPLSTLMVPYEEFRQILFFLPDFSDLPIFTNAWRNASEPTVFVVKCFDGGRTQQGDEFWVDTQGYGYPRYKAALRRV